MPFHEFIVEEAGIQTRDGRVLMPGSRLVLKNSAPPAWARLGRETGKNVGERSLQPATPKAEAVELDASSAEKGEEEYKDVNFVPVADVTAKPDELGDPDPSPVAERSPAPAKRRGRKRKAQPQSGGPAGTGTAE